MIEVRSCMSRMSFPRVTTAPRWLRSTSRRSNLMRETGIASPLRLTTVAWSEA